MRTALRTKGTGERSQWQPLPRRRLLRIV